MWHEDVFWKKAVKEDIAYKKSILPAVEEEAPREVEEEAEESVTAFFPSGIISL